MTLSDNCGYSFLIPYQNLTSGSFLQFSCSVESETMSLNFRCCYTKTHWSQALNGTLPHTRLCNAMHGSLLSVP